MADPKGDAAAGRRLIGTPAGFIAERADFTSECWLASNRNTRPASIGIRSNAMDVRATVDRLATEGVKVHCLALGA
jgi:hypothetical protein